MKDRVDLDELTELINIPEFERIVYHKVEELKYVFKEKIDLYRNLKNNFKKTAYGNLQIYENDAPQKNQTYRFELNRIQNDAWILTKIEPFPPGGIDISHIIPESIIKHIVCFKTDPDKIYNFSGKASEAGPEKFYDTEFTKYSDHHVLGTIREIGAQEEPSTKPETEKEIKIIKADEKYERKSDEYNFSELFYYMQKYPEIKKHIFGDFFQRLKPRIDNNLMKVTSG